MTRYLVTVGLTGLVLALLVAASFHVVNVRSYRYEKTGFEVFQTINPN